MGTTKERRFSTLDVCHERGAKINQLLNLCFEADTNRSPIFRIGELNRCVELRGKCDFEHLYCGGDSWIFSRDFGSRTQCLLCAFDITKETPAKPCGLG